MSVSLPGSEAALLDDIAITCIALAIASVLVWCGVFAVRMIRLRRAHRNALAEEELTGLVLDQLAGYSPPSPQEPLPPWKRRILAQVLRTLIEQTKGRDQALLVALLDRFGFRAEALAHVAHGRAAQRQSACEVLSSFDDETSVAALEGALGDPDFGVRLAAARALLPKDRVPSLRRLLAQMRFPEDDPPLSLAELCARLPHSLRPEAITMLGEPMPAEWLRTLAIALARSQVYESFESLAQLRHHPAPRVRAAAWVALRELGDPRAGEFVSDGLADPVADVRRAAAECAGRLGGTDILPSLQRLAREPDWWVSYSGADALWEFGADGRALLATEPGTLGEGARQFVREKQAEATRD